MAKKENKKKQPKKTAQAQPNPHTMPQTHPLTSQPNPATAKDVSEMTAEELHQAQLEQALRESADPSARLRKLKNPLNVKGCLLSLLLGFVLIVAIVYIVTFIRVDKFDFVFVTKDILEKSGISDFYNDLVDKVKELFGAKEEETPVETAINLFNMTIGRWFR